MKILIKTIDVRRQLSYLYIDFQPKIQFIQFKTQFFIMNTPLYSRMRCMLLLLVFSLTTLITFAQDRRVTGKVTGGDGQGVPGVSVLLKGTQTGASTDANGMFAINLKTGNDVLTFSGIGFKSTEVKVGSQTTVNVTLIEDVAALDEVIVTGYSVDKRRESTGAVSVVKAKDLTVVPSANVEQQLQGRVAGLTVITNSQPGTSSIVRIRGYGAFGGNEPLIIVDGLPVGSAFLNPDDIESTTVLKDASTASIYGARAANGVIIYTTKRGTKGAKKLSVTYDGLYGITDPGKGQKMMNPQDQATWTWNALRNSGADLTHPQYGTGPTPELPDYLKVGENYGVRGTVDLAAERLKYNITGPDISNFYQVIKANKEGTDWYKELTRVAPVQRHTLGFSGGGESSRFYVGLSAQNQKGILPSQEATRYAFRINTEFNILKNLRLGENIQGTYFQILGLTGGNGGIGSSADENDILAAFRAPTIIPVYDEFGGYAGTTAIGLGQGSNPIANQEGNKRNKNFNGFATGNIYLEYDPIPNLTLRSSIGGNYRNSFDRGYGRVIYETLENKGTIIGFNENASYSFGWTFTNTASYKRSFGKHGVELLIGQEALNTGAGRGLGSSGRNPFSPDDDYVTLTTLDIKNPAYSYIDPGVNFDSYFGRAIYNFNDKYIVTGVIRRDGSSRFGANNRYGIFPALSAAWRISAEDFMKDLPWIQDLKIRGGYGEMGNSNNVNPSNQYSLYAQSAGSTGYDINGTNAGIINGFNQSRIGNPNAKWETSITKNIGFDGTFLRGKLDIVLDVWQKDTKDLLYQLPITQLAGGATAPSVNIGTMVNKGIDILVSTKGKINSDFSYELDVTGGLLNNEITYIADGQTYLTDVNPGFRGVNPIRNQLNRPLSAFFGYKVKGLFQTKEEVTEALKTGGAVPTQTGAGLGRFRYEDVDGNGVIDANDRTYLGSPVAKFTGGLSFKLIYKDFDFSAYMYTSLGAQIFNISKRFTDFYPLFAGSAISERVKDTWTPTNTGATIPIFEKEDGFSTSSQASSYYVENGSYLRLQNISIGYTLPKALLSKLNLSKLRVFATTNNLFTITGYSGLDPQVAGNADTGFGIDLGNFPVTRSVTFGLNLGF
jgi:TonB-dependent starch-binding outer membrane protein SusC